MGAAVLALVFLGGVLTLLSPCILPVIPLVLARAGRSFVRETAPMLLGLAATFTGSIMLASATGRWLATVNVVGRDVALLLLFAVGLSLASVRVAEWLARPMTRLGASLLSRGVGRSVTPARNAVVGAAIGLLWAPCAGPILGLVIAAAAVEGPSRGGILLFTFALGASMSLALVSALGDRIIARARRAAASTVLFRRIIGGATIATVIMIFMGWDRAVFARSGLVRTAGAEELLVRRLAADRAQRTDAGLSVDAFLASAPPPAPAARPVAPASLGVMTGTLPGFDGATAWINSPPLTPESLRGKVVMVQFWTFGCYNCLNAIPHVKELYAKYKDRGFVVVSVHTPEFARERVLGNVRDEVRRLGITYPVAVDNDSRIWNAFNNRYWPAAYYADATGKLRFYHFGEGRYEEQDQGWRHCSQRPKLPANLP